MTQGRPGKARFARLLAGGLLAAGLTTGASGAAAQSADEEVLAQLQAFVTAYNAEDSAAIGQIYAEDGALLPPQSNPINGSADIAAFYASVFQQADIVLRIRVDELTQLDDETVLVIIAAVAEFDGEDGTRVQQVGRSMHVWRRAGSGWRLQRDMFNIIARGPAPG